MREAYMRQAHTCMWSNLSVKEKVDISAGGYTVDAGGPQTEKYGRYTQWATMIMILLVYF